jgi:four helix bundle protein
LVIVSSPEEIRERTKKFAIRIVRLFRALPKSTEAQVLGKQLLRSGTSVAANYRAVCRARSKAEFIARIGIVAEEADESVLWLEMLAETQTLRRERLRDITKEARELAAIFSASLKTSRDNQQITQSRNYSITKSIMDLSKLPPGVLSQLASAVDDYITGSRRKYSPRATPLSPEQQAAMHPFFAAETLDQTRLLVLNGSRISDPPFYTMARVMGIRNLPSFSDVAAVTFVDVVVSHEEFSDDLLFHELVHVVQYAQLGSKEFSVRYVNGFIKSGNYEGIPLEKQAHDLDSRFSANPSQPFSVAEEVRSAIEAGKL